MRRKVWGILTNELHYIFLCGIIISQLF